MVGRRLPFPRLMAEPSPGLSMHEEMITEIAAGSTLARFRRVFGKTYPMSEKSRSLASLCNITTQRARSTIATQLGNAKDPMLLLELQQWLGHRWPASTLNYIRVTPTRLAKAYADAGYFGRNLRVVEVLIDI